jgi:hypothetical protein
MLLCQSISYQFLVFRNNEVEGSVPLRLFYLWKWYHTVFSKRRVTITSDAAPQPRRTETLILYQFGWSDKTGCVLNNLGTSASADLTWTLPLYMPRSREFKSLVTDGAFTLEQRAIILLFFYHTAICNMQWRVLKGYAEKKFCYSSQRWICGLD